MSFQRYMALQNDANFKTGMSIIAPHIKIAGPANDGPDNIALDSKGFHVYEVHHALSPAEAKRLTDHGWVFFPDGPGWMYSAPYEPITS